MNKRTKKILGASLSLAAFSFGYTQNVQAQTCSQPLSCEELGFTETEEQCANGGLIRCPSDLSKVFCRKDCSIKTCTGYNLTSCPSNANCSQCTITSSNCSTQKKYKIDSCKNGSISACSNYPLSSCPENGNCSSCDIINSDCSNNGTKYKLDSCYDNYKISGNSCIPKTCEDGGFFTDIPSGQTCSTISYAGKNCYTDCKEQEKTYQCSFDGYSYWLTNGPYWLAQYGQIGVDAECECNCGEFPVYVRLEKITSANVYDSFEQGMNTPGEETQRNGEVTYNCGLMCDRTVTEDDSFEFVN